MSEQPWDRQPGESNRWYQRFELFRLMGPNRSLSGSANAERVAQGRKESKDASGKWRQIAKTFNWVKRAEAWDTFLIQQAAARAEAERLEILNSGFALPHERVKALKKLGVKLEAEIETSDHLWLPDAKMIGQNPFAERVDFERFNAPLIEQFRGTLDDLAKETGGRVIKQDITSNGETIKATDDRYDRALSSLADALRGLIPGAGDPAESVVDSPKQAPVVSVPKPGG